MPECRFLPFALADGPTNMAADEVQLLGAAQGTASLRFYGWSRPTVSMGYFQPYESCRKELNLPQLSWVRRATGGKALVHHHELTYALALPKGSPWQGRQSWLERMHQIIQAALGRHGITSHVQGDNSRARPAEALCFQTIAAFDLLIENGKICGSAQRKQKGALLQHGGILMARSPYAPMLPGLADLGAPSLTALETRDSVACAFEQMTGWKRVAGDWTEAESVQIHDLAKAKYAGAHWTQKR